MPRTHRVTGALVGAAVGNALGAPFTGAPPRGFSARFPAPARGVHTEMCGGGPLGLDPGGTTDDVEQTLLLATSLVEHRGLADVAADDTSPAGTAAGGTAPESTAPGSSALLHTVPTALFAARQGPDATADLTRRVAERLGGDAAVAAECVLFAGLLRAAFDGADPASAVPGALELLPAGQRDHWRTALDAGDPPADGAPVLARALWALHGGAPVADALRRAVDLGGDTAGVAAVTGALAGAVHGVVGIPMRWTSVVHGRVPGAADKDWWLADLYKLAAGLDGDRIPAFERPLEMGPGPEEVVEGLWASDLDGARGSSPDFAVISLCRTGTRFAHAVQRFAHLVDDDSNTEIDVVLADVLDDIAALRAEGRPVLVHCYAGQSRTGLVLRAWLRRTAGMSVEQATDAVLETWPYLSTDNDSFTAALERMG